MLLSIHVLRPSSKIDLGLATAKLSFLTDHAQDYHIIFLGSSRTYRMIDSKAIERQLVDKGCSLRVFNMGVPNLTLEEQDYLIDKITSMPDSAFQMIILEEPLSAFIHLDQARSKRAQMLKGINIISRRFENIFSYQEPLHKKIYRLGVSLYSFGYGLLNIGLVSERLFPEAYLPAEQEEKEIIIREQKTFSSLGGFRILEKDLEQNERAHTVRKNFLAQKEAFEKKLRHLKENPVKPSIFSAQKRASLLKEQFIKIEKAGLSTAFYVPPLPSRIAENKALTTSLKHDIFILNYNDPSHLPIIWHSDYWFDPYHLNREGARLMSQDIGRTLYKSICPRYAYIEDL